MNNRIISFRVLSSTNDYLIDLHKKFNIPNAATTPSKAQKQHDVRHALVVANQNGVFSFRNGVARKDKFNLGIFFGHQNPNAKNRARTPVVHRPESLGGKRPNQSAQHLRRINQQR